MPCAHAYNTMGVSAHSVYIQMHKHTHIFLRLNFVDSYSSTVCILGNGIFYFILKGFFIKKKNEKGP